MMRVLKNYFSLNILNQILDEIKYFEIILKQNL